jgi:hypothetical protein
MKGRPLVETLGGLDAMMVECAWCGGEPDKEYPNRRGEIFCSASHRSSSNRALKRLQARETDDVDTN